MNKDRRRAIQEIVVKLEDIRTEIDALHTEEIEYIDSLPDNMQSGERAEKAQSAADNLDSAMSDLDTVVDDLNSAME